MKQMRRRLRKIILFLFVALLFWIVGVGAMIWSFGNRDDARKSDCAIVLGAAAYGEKPSPVFEERIRHAIALYQAGTVSKIVFTGGFGDRAEHAESTVGAEYAVRAGVPRADLLTETKSRTTWQNLVEAKGVMEAAGLKTAILVSDPLHLKRSANMAEALGISAVTSPTPTSRYQSFGVKFEFLAREIYFWHHDLLVGR
jgi:uncharacterized SAM-binding protein YcdF (DUF218 family)